MEQYFVDLDTGERWKSVIAARRGTVGVDGHLFVSPGTGRLELPLLRAGDVQLAERTVREIECRKHRTPTEEGSGGGASGSVDADSRSSSEDVMLVRFAPSLLPGARAPSRTCADDWWDRLDEHRQRLVDSARLEEARRSLTSDSGHPPPVFVYAFGEDSCGLLRRRLERSRTVSTETPVFGSVNEAIDFVMEELAWKKV